MNLYKFTHKLLLKSDGKLKQKSDKKKKSQVASYRVTDQTKNRKRKRKRKE